MRLVALGGTEGGQYKVESGKLKFEIGCGRGFFDLKNLRKR